MKIANFKKSKVTPKLSALLSALAATFFLVACGGGGSAVGSDSADSVKNGTGSTGVSGASGSSGTSGTSGTAGTSGMGKDDDDCMTTPTPAGSVMAKHKDIDDDENEIDDDDDDEKCNPATLPPLTAADLAAGKLGKALWATNCFSCHGSDTHEVRTAARILHAINENKGGMGALKGVITATDAANIAIYAARPSAF